VTAASAAQKPGAQPPPAARTTVTPAAASRAAGAVDPGFRAAVPIAQALPAWQPPAGVVAQRGFSGAVRVTIDPSGKVTGAVMEPSVYPPYDRLVLTAARNWTYQPATRNGEPVASERLVEIVLRPRVSP
jgi:protein TonB